MPWCPICKAEYREGFTECASCHVPLVEELTEEQKKEPAPDYALPEGIKKPIAVYMAKNKLDAELVCDLLHENDIVALSRPAAFRQIQAYSGSDNRFGVEIVVDASQTAQARAVIDEMKHDIEDTPMDEDELARLAEEQSEQTTEQPAEDNTAFRMLPVIAGVIAVALVLLYFVTNRM